MVSFQAALLALALAGAGDTVLLDFSAEWCGPCRQMESTVTRLSARGFPVRKVNVDEHRQLAQQMHVDQIPCFVLVVKGREVKRLIGNQSEQDLEQMFRAAGIAPASGKNRTRAQSPDDETDTMFPPIASAPLGSSPVTDLPQTLEAETPPAATRADAWPESHVPAAPAAVTGQAYAPGHAAADAIVRRLLAASVRLRISDGRGNSDVGSGTIVDARVGEALVLTCGHVFRDSQGKGSITIDLFGPGAPQNLPGKLVSYDLQSDLGLVSFKPGVPVVAARVAPSGHAVRENDAVINIGCNHGENPTARVTHVTAINKFLGPPNLVAAGQPEQGRSGGGLFTTDGYLVGVCNFADPEDREGVYRAVAAVQTELERMDLLEMCLEPVDPTSGNVLAAAVEPPPMPERMPQPGKDPSHSGLLATSDAAIERVGGLPATGSLPTALSAQETATLAEIRRRGVGAEVICIVRSLADPRAKSEIIVLDRASPEFLDQLSSQVRVQQGRHLTSHRQPSRRQPAPRNAALSQPKTVPSVRDTSHGRQ